MTDNADGRLYQFTAVAVGGRAILIEGPPGCGKTSLALTLIDRGATLIGDDGVALYVEGSALVAAPAGPTRGQLEIRNVGIVNSRSTSAPVALVLQCDHDAPRFVEKAEQRMIEGVAIPMLKFAIGNPADAIRAEHALDAHGIGG